ncbi:MAG: hypothetical protein AAF249_04395 [Pseudomonadota bacterium]
MRRTLGLAVGLVGGSVAASLGLAAVSMASAQDADSPPVPPADRPEILGAGTVSKPDRYEYCQTFSRDRRTLTIGVEHGDWQSIETYKWDGAQWEGPTPIIGSPDFNAHDPYLSADEQRLYFINQSRGSADLAYLPRQDDGSWGDPIYLPAPINGPGNDYYTSITSDGSVFFSSNRKGSKVVGTRHRSKAKAKPNACPNPSIQAGMKATPMSILTAVISSSPRTGAAGRGAAISISALRMVRVDGRIPLPSTSGSTPKAMNCARSSRSTAAPLCSPAIRTSDGFRPPLLMR